MRMFSEDRKTLNMKLVSKDCECLLVDSPHEPHEKVTHYKPYFSQFEGVKVPIIIDSRNEFSFVLGSAEFKKVEYHKIVIGLKIYETEYKNIFYDVITETGWATKLIIEFGKLVALSITPFRD